MRIRIITVVTILLLLAGAAVLLYPAVSSRLAERNQTTAIQAYSVSVAQLTEAEREAELERARAYNDMLTGAGITDPFVPESGFVIPEEYTSILNINGVMGHIEIPAIGVDLPIYHGTDDEVLEKGAGHMEATAFPIGGEGNHTVLTGHSGLPTAELFTRLEELDLGDVFYITVLDETLCYQVDQITVVEPDQTEALRPVAGEDYVTLVTCTPYAVNSHRLLVRGTATPYSPEDRTEDGGEVPEGGAPIAAIAAGGTALAVFGGLAIRRYRGKKR